MRLWFWLDRLTTGAELTQWLRGTPVDPSVFRTVQPIYTAAPVFAARAGDHLPQRMVLLPGAAAVQVPPPDTLRPPPPRPQTPLPQPGDIRASRYAFAALISAAARVGQAAVGQRHTTVLGEGRGLARFVDAGLLAERDVIAVLRSTDLPEDEVTSLIAWALKHPSGAPLPESVAP